jgi:chaperone required for assembly of F1-ATPase
MARAALANAAAMKRFYKAASPVPVDGGFAVHLDGRPVKTPGKALLVVPTQKLADAIAEEWNAQGDKIDPRGMPLTSFANAAIERVAPERAAFAAGLAAYGESDLLCYRADHPQLLASRQAERWDPLLDWARRRFDVDFEIIAGIMHRAQPEMTVKRLAQAVAARGPFELAALSPLVTLSGSVVIALALAEEAVDQDEAWAAATVDEEWQAEKWGEDAEASARMFNRRRDFDAAYRFFNLI